MLWNRFIGSSYAQAEYPFWNMRLKDNPEMWRWYFGDWQSRLNVATWAQGLWRMLNCTWGRFALALTTLWALLFSRRQLACYWFLATVVTVLIFSNIVLVHRHYYLMFTAPAAMLAAAAVLKMEALLRETKKHSLALTEAGILVALVVAAVQGLIGVKIVENYDPYPHAIAQARREYTAPDDKVIIFGGGWGGKELILADRTGLSIAKMQLLDDDRAYARLRELGFNRLVMLSESPLNHALQMTNPGQARLQRWMYRQCMTPKAAQFGTLYGIRGSDHQVTALMMNETKRC